MSKLSLFVSVPTVRAIRLQIHRIKAFLVETSVCVCFKNFAADLNFNYTVIDSTAVIKVNLISSHTL